MRKQPKYNAFCSNHTWNPAVILSSKLMHSPSHQWLETNSFSVKGLKFTWRGQGGTRAGMKLKNNVSYYSDRQVTIDLSANRELAASLTAMISFYAQLATWHTVHGTLQLQCSAWTLMGFSFHFRFSNKTNCHLLVRTSVESQLSSSSAFCAVSV